MRIAWGISWDDGKKGRVLAAFFALALSLTLLAPVQGGRTSGAERMISVIVREMPGAGSAPETLVKSLGGKIELQLGIINGFSADVPAAALDDLRASRAVYSVSENRPLKLLGETYVPKEDPGSSYNLGKVTKARDLWASGITGKGVDVALIDSGVAPVNGLTNPGQVVNGPDLSFEQGAENLRYLDTFGHGTHIAGLIAGRDNGLAPSANELNGFLGIAPEARIISLKVANAVGATDVSQVIAAIDWVVTHRNTDGLNIRVLNLSFGTDGTQNYVLDPLAYAAEVAWHKGIVVVAAAGNGNYGTTKLNNPAYDPYVIAVGANDTKGTHDVSDDTIPDWSSRGDGTRNPDVVAPGKSVVSLRTPGSYIDSQFGGTGRVSDRFFRGTGTSQSAAVVSGAAALLLSQRPNLTPDQVKALLVQTARPLPAADPVAQGAGMIDLKGAAKAATPSSVQTFTPSTGLGSLDLARGTAKVVSPDGALLEGEQDIFGVTWDGARWSADLWTGAGWSGGIWRNAEWTGAGWSGAGWSGAGWSGAGWSGAGWSGAGWSGAGWSGAGWSGAGWSGAGWSGAGWSGAGWSGAGWSGAGWSGAGWSGAGWS